MADAVVQVVEGRAVATPFGASLLAPYVAAAAAAQEAAEAAAEAAGADAGSVDAAAAAAIADIGEETGLAIVAVQDERDDAIADVAAQQTTSVTAVQTAQATAETAVDALVTDAENAAASVTTLLPVPFRPEDYDQPREFPNITIGGTSNVTNVSPTRLTVPATSGTMTMTGTTYMPVTAGQDVAVWFEEVTGTPTTKLIRFLNSGGTQLGSDIAMSKVGAHWVAATTAPATAAWVRLTVTNTTGSAVVIGRPRVATKKNTTLSLGTATITIASPGVVTRVAHGLENGDRVTLTTTGALPTGLSASTIYYVVNKTTDDFQLATSSGGTAINTSGSQSGTHTLFKRVELTKDGVFDPQTTAVQNLLASTPDDDLPNVWRIAADSGSAVARESGSGTVPVLNADGTITVYADTLIRARANLTKLVPGDSIVILIKLNKTANPRRVYAEFGGSPNTNVYAESLGEGLWGIKTTVPAVGTLTYIDAQIDNLNSSYYTASDLTVEWIEATRGTKYPNARPSLPYQWPAEQIVVQQYITNSGGIDYNSFHINHAPSSKLGSRKCIRWKLEEYRASAGGGQGWQLLEFYEAERVTDDWITYTTGRISDQGLHQLAVYEAGQNFMGGTHGYEASGINLGNPTITIATPGVVTLAAHGLSNGDRVSFTTSGALPTGLTAGAVYYVVNAATNTFELSATSGGSSIATSGSQSGTHTLRKRTEVFLLDGVPVAFDGTTTLYGKTFEMIQVSQLISHSGSGVVKFNVVTRVKFDWLGCTLHQRLVTVGTVNVLKTYTAMLSTGLQYNASGATQWDTFRSSPDYTAVASAGAGDTEGTGADLMLTGPLGISVRATMLSGWDTWATRKSRLQRTGTSRKFYFSPTGHFGDGEPVGYTLTDGTVVETVARFEIRTVN